MNEQILLSTKCSIPAQLVPGMLFKVVRSVPWWTAYEAQHLANGWALAWTWRLIPSDSVLLFLDLELLYDVSGSCLADNALPHVFMKFLWNNQEILIEREFDFVDVSLEYIDCKLVDS